MKKNKLKSVAITGIGIVSCLGNNMESVVLALKNGHSGIVYDEQRKNLGFKSPLTGLHQKIWGLPKKP